MVNDIKDCAPPNLDVTSCKYADVCTQYELVATNSTSHMQDVANNLEAWATKNKMVLNENKTKEMWICFKKSCPSPESIKINGTELEKVEVFKLLGMYVRNDLKWNTHVQDILSRVGRRMYYLRECRRANFPAEVGLITYLSKIRLLLEYASPVWGGLPAYLTTELQRVQNRCMDIIGQPIETLFRHFQNAGMITQFTRVHEHCKVRQTLLRST
jgi:hypothetical protein